MGDASVPMVPVASSLILAPGATENSFTDEWKDFLSHPDVDLKAVVVGGDVPPPAGGRPRRDISVEYKDESKPLDPLAFSSKNNFEQFQQDTLDVEGSVILSLPKNQPEWGIKLGAILRSFGVVPKDENDFQVPDNLGELAQFSPGQPLPQPDKSRGLVGWIVDELGRDRQFLLDTETGSRNYVWLSQVQQVLRSEVAITLKPSGLLSAILQGIQHAVAEQLRITDEDAINFSNFRIYIQRACEGTRIVRPDGTKDWNIAISFRLCFNFGIGSTFVFWINQERSSTKKGMSVAITSPKSVGDILKLSNQSAAKPPLNDFLEHFLILQVVFSKKADESLWWRLTAALSAGPKKVKYYLQYDSNDKIFHGGLIRKGFYKNTADKRLPTFRPGEDLEENPSPTEPPESWNIRQFMDEFEALPHIIPTVIETGTIDYNIDTKDLQFDFKLVRDKNPEDKKKVVPDPFTWEELNMSVVRKGDGSFSLKGTTTFKSKTPSSEAKLDLGVTYLSESQKKYWEISGYMENFTGAWLVELFSDPNHQKSLSKILGKLSLQKFRVIYTYEKGVQGSPGPASSFAMTAVVGIGKFQLQMFYQYTSSTLSQPSAAELLKKEVTALELPETLKIAQTPGPNDPPMTAWKFECNLFSSETGSKLRDVMASLSDGIANALPSCIGDIEVPSPETPQKRGLIYIKAERVKEGQRDQVLFLFRVAINAFTLIYLQASGKPDTDDEPRRLLRFSCDKIPVLPNVPLLGQLPQPFDQLQYLWLSGGGDNDGLSTADINNLNKNLLDEKDRLSTLKITGDPANKPPPVAIDSVPILLHGHHFLVINKGVAIIDHRFFTGEGSQTNDQDRLAPNALVPFDEAPSSTGATPNNPPSKGALTFTLGPLTISAITLQVKNHDDGMHLELSMDATFVLGPIANPVITFALLGFTIGIPLAKVHLDNLSQAYKEIVPSLHGLSFGFDKPPVTIAGGFEHDKQNGVEYYMGGITIGFPPYTFVGLGEYMILDGYKSVFLYAKLDGPLITLGVATISGIRLGLGFNSIVRSPTLDEITEFPFINDKSVAGAGNNPMAILKQIMQPPSGKPWVSPKNESYWLAAGLTMEAFEIISVTAVAMLAFRDSGLVISMFADAIAQMPPHVNDPALMIIYVEVGLMAEMNFAEGYFMIAASVAPTSFLLVSACRLYGQFAMTYWFAPNEHAGDWVFSVGGYHPRYEPPAWYPRPKRLGISFVTYGISIVGEAYFAITPKAIMGGALIRATLSVGPVRAWLETQFDALINLHPFHYDVSFRISVGIDCHIKVWFVHVHVSVSVGAQLQIYGPDFGGSAYVDFYLFSFTVDFGASPDAPAPLDLLPFWEMVHRPGPETESVNNNEPNPILSRLDYGGQISTQAKAAFKFALEDGSFPMPKQIDQDDRSDPKSTGDGEPWYVKGGSFRFRINSDFAVDKVVVAGDNPITVQPIPQDEAGKIYSKPMHVSKPIESTMTITIRDTETKEIIGGWQKVHLDFKKVPTASWGKYDRTADPLAGDASKTLLSNDDTTVRLAMGIVLSAPPPLLSDSKIPPFDAKEYMLMEILDFRKSTNGKGKQWYIPSFEPQQTTYLAAQLENSEAEKPIKDQFHSFEDKWKDLAKKQTLVNNAEYGVLQQFSSLLEWDTDRPQISTQEDEGGQPSEPTPSLGTSPGGDVNETIVRVSGQPNVSPLALPPGPEATAWRLVGDFPIRLLARFEDKYLEIPRMAVASA